MNVLERSTASENFFSSVVLADTLGQHCFTPSITFGSEGLHPGSQSRSVVGFYRPWPILFRTCFLHSCWKMDLGIFTPVLSKMGTNS